uniref:TNFAIP3 interacting protein 1 n=1 Tax=Eptatretus burgeri TaxID=7764 RepID=A0A8C4WS42_EPTBU
MSSAVLLESCAGEFGTGKPPDTSSACDSAQDADIRDLPWPHVLRYEKLLSENKDLKQKLTCCTNLGTFLGESQVEVSKLQKLVENLKQENARLKTPPCDEPPQQNRESICATTDSFVFEGNKSEEQLEPHKFEKKTLLPQSMILQQLFDDISMDGGNLMQQMQRVEDSLSHCATQFKKASPNTAGATFATGSTEGSQGLVQHDILTRFGILAMEFHRLASSVHKSEERTAGLQTLCERLVKENGELRERLEKGMVPQVCGKAPQTRQASEDCRQGWQSHTDRKEDKVDPADFGFNNRPEMKGAIGFVKVMDKQMHKEHTEESLKLVCQKVKTLEKQRKELLDVNKQWDEQFRTMKIQYESKITELRARLESSKRWALESSGNQERREREFDRALLTARDRNGRDEQERQRLESELREARAQAELHNRKLEQMDREVRRLNKALADALAHGPGAIPGANRKDQAHFPECEGREDLLTQVAVLKEQVKIYEEDFRKERADRERMNTQNEEIRLEDLKLKEKMDLTSAKLINIEETLAKEKQEKEHLQRLMKTYRPQSERRQEEERCGPLLTQGNYQQEGGWGNGFSGIEEMRYPPRDKHWDYRLRPPPPYQPNNLDDIEHD